MNLTHQLYSVYTKGRYGFWLAKDQHTLYESSVHMEEPAISEIKLYFKTIQTSLSLK